jgi:hypothetical protein
MLDDAMTSPPLAVVDDYAEKVDTRPPSITPEAGMKMRIFQASGQVGAQVRNQRLSAEKRSKLARKAIRTR